MLNFFINWLVFYTFKDVTLASQLGYFAGVFVGYPLNKFWAFKIASNEKARKSEIYLYFIVYAMSFFINSKISVVSYNFFEENLTDFLTTQYLNILYYIPPLELQLFLITLDVRHCIQGKHS